MDHIVEEFVLGVPQVDPFAVHVGHGMRDVEKVLEVFERHVLIERLVAGQFDGDREHGDAKQRHPTRAVALFEQRAVGQSLVAVETANVVHAQEAAAEHVATARVLAIDPEAEAEHLVLEHFLEEVHVAPAGLLHFDLIDAPRRPADHGRVDVVKVPLVGRILTASMLIPFATHAQQLPLGKCRVDPRDRHAVKREIPGGIPGILPGVGHQDHVGVVQFLPARVASVPALFGGRGLRGIALEPAVHVVVVVLF